MDAAGLIGVASSTRSGLQPSGLGFTNTYIYLEAGESKTIECRGFLLIRNSYSWAGFELWFCSNGTATKLSGTTYSILINVVSTEDTVTVTNNGKARRGIQLIYQFIPKLNG